MHSQLVSSTENENQTSFSVDKNSRHWVNKKTRYQRFSCHKQRRADIVGRIGVFMRRKCFGRWVPHVLHKFHNSFHMRVLAADCFDMTSPNMYRLFFFVHVAVTAVKFQSS